MSRVLRPSRIDLVGGLELIYSNFLMDLSLFTARSMGYGGHGHEVQRVSMNELPVPEGSWQNFYEAQQRKYNRHLILGISFFLFTVGVVSFLPSNFSRFTLKIDGTKH